MVMVGSTQSEFVHRLRPTVSDELTSTLMGFDADKDGRLTRTEVPERFQGLFERADANMDGVLTAGGDPAVGSAAGSEFAGGTRWRARGTRPRRVRRFPTAGDRTRHRSRQHGVCDRDHRWRARRC